MDTAVFQIFLKYAWEYIIYVLPFHLDIFFYGQLSVFIDKQAHRHLLNCISSCTFNDVLWPCSFGGHCICTTERWEHTYDTWRERNINGNKSISWKPKSIWGLTFNALGWLTWKIAQFSPGGWETDFENFAIHSPDYQEVEWLLKLCNA